MATRVLVYGVISSLVWLTAVIGTSGLVRAQEQPKPGTPRITVVSVVASDIVSLTVSNGEIEYGKQTGTVRTFDKLLGTKLNTRIADVSSTYVMSSTDDKAFGAGTSPIAVYRKSRPVGMAQTGQWEWKAPQEHTIYLKFDKHLKTGKHYKVSCPEGRLPLESVEFAWDPKSIVSEALHVSQIGFRPDDPGKLAFLSCWMGSGGSLSYQDGLTFNVIDDVTEKVVFTGKVVLSKAAGQEDEDPYNRNYNLTDVYEMDFTSLKKPGTYRLFIDSIGCSRPFKIGYEVWREAFRVSAKGFYNQRSGIATGQPYTEFSRPRAFHADDGVKVYASTCSLLNSGNGLNAEGTDEDNFHNLLAGRTDELIPGTWGGYFDAGDWDRRIQHLWATRLLLELVELFPDYFKKLSLTIPESGNGLPDVVNESLWGLDFFRRLQTKDGGIRGGIESADHPLYGEASWQNSLTNYAYAPDPWSSYIYAGVAARASLVLKTLQPEQSRIYRESAIRAMDWAEKELPKLERKQGPLPYVVRDERNLAAAELYRLTGDRKYNRLFLDTTAFTTMGTPLFVWQDHNQNDAAFVYARLDKPGVDKDVRDNCRRAIIDEADASALFGRNTAFHWVKAQPYATTGWGKLGSPDAVNLLRAHSLTGKWEYLRAAVLACQYGAGANPMNMTMTTGVGWKYPKFPLVVDARVTGRQAPPGITVYGALDTTKMDGDFGAKLIEPYCFPSISSWPTTEAYFDVYMYPSICEFTIMETMGPNAYVWGYLAARK